MYQTHPQPMTHSTASLEHKKYLQPKILSDALDIMLIEDVHTDAVLTKLALEATNVPMEVNIVSRGDDALSTIEWLHMSYPKRLPDLLLLDLGLPGVDGFEMLSELSEMPATVRAIPIIILTAHQHFEYLQRTYPLCILSYMPKPCYADDLALILSQLRNNKLQRDAS